MKYFPIATTPNIDASMSDLMNLTYSGGELKADFYMDEMDKAFRVYFEWALIFRVLDEFPLSMEEEGCPSDGLVKHGFAYRVDEAPFWKAQSAVFLKLKNSAQHYRFITSGICLDVISEMPPVFSVVAVK